MSTKVPCQNPGVHMVQFHIAGSSAAADCARPYAAKDRNHVRVPPPPAPKKTPEDEAAEDFDRAVRNSFSSMTTGKPTDPKTAAKQMFYRGIRHPDIDDPYETLDEIENVLIRNPPTKNKYGQFVNDGAVEALMDGDWTLDKTLGETTDEQDRALAQELILHPKVLRSMTRLNNAGPISPSAWTGRANRLHAEAEASTGQLLSPGAVLNAYGALVDDDQFVSERMQGSFTSGSGKRIQGYLLDSARSLAQSINASSGGKVRARVTTRSDNQPDITLDSHPGVRLVVNDPRDGIDPSRGRNMEWTVERAYQRTPIGKSVDDPIDEIVEAATSHLPLDGKTWSDRLDDHYDRYATPRENAEKLVREVGLRDLYGPKRWDGVEDLEPLVLQVEASIEQAYEGHDPYDRLQSDPLEDVAEHLNSGGWDWPS